MSSLLTETSYPHDLQDLAIFIQQPTLPLTLQQFLFFVNNPDSTSAPHSLSKLPQFHGHVNIHHSAVATFFALSDLCSVGGMRQERICSTPSWYAQPRYDAIYVVLDDTLPSMEGMVIARVCLLFSFNYKRVNYNCAFVNWLVCDDDEPLDRYQSFFVNTFVDHHTHEFLVDHY